MALSSPESHVLGASDRVSYHVSARRINGHIADRADGDPITAPPLARLDHPAIGPRP